ncbi:hypothetical protein THRCLA_00727 [Thraustotheca clavata]|uniref:Elicitin n=1 Tax=Thraustotheca clavata TaxID=74557 RepID=A0A1W0AAC1_9STRA|nr:hypothetical protein THRCLA_00727 [Thraustotheca clavata]
MGAVVVAGSSCTVDTMNAIEKQILAFPTLKSCDQPTPGWSFYDFYTEDNAFPTTAQIATFESYPPCKTVYEAFQKVINETSACDYYPNEPIQKLGSFGSFGLLVDYVKSHEYKSISNAQETSTGNSTTATSNDNANNNGTSQAVTTAPLSHCTVADIGSITAQIKAIPQNAECANTTKFNFEDFFAQTNIFPSAAQMDLFSATKACEILLVDVQIILRQGPSCLFYDNVSLQQMANFTSIQDIVQLEMMHEHPGQSPTTSIPGSSSSTSTKASTENGAGTSAVSVIGIIAIVAAVVLAVVGAIWYIRRKRQHHDKLDQQSIYVVNAHAAL